MASTPSLPVTYGQSLRNLAFEGFALNETLHTPGFGLPTHSHPNATAAFVLDGEFEERLDGRAVSCGPGSLLVKPADQLHSNRYGARGARCLLVELDRNYRDVTDLAPLDRPVHFADAFAAEASRALLRELTDPDEVTPLVVEGVFFEFLGALRVHADAGRGRPAWLRTAVAYVNDCFLHSLRVRTIAGAAGVHPIHLAREFRRHLGISPGELVRLRRVSHARECLAARGKPLAAIADACGFADQSHLTRSFSRRYGISPAKYRRRVWRSVPARGSIR